MKLRPFSIIPILVLLLTQANGQGTTEIDKKQTTILNGFHGQIRDYSEVPIRDVLRELAKEAKISLFISDLVKGNLSLRLEDKSPMTSIQIICESKGLILDSNDDVYYVKTPAERLRSLHYLDNPALPVALAKFKKRYYDALVSVGFSKTDALKIVISESLPLNDITIDKP